MFAEQPAGIWEGGFLATSLQREPQKQIKPIIKSEHKSKRNSAPLVQMDLLNPTSVSDSTFLQLAFLKEQTKLANKL